GNQRLQWSVSRLLEHLNQILCMAWGSLVGQVSSVGSMAFRNRRAAALHAKLSRSWLLVNAAKEETFAPSLACEADAVIFDMEAAVPGDQKIQARDNVVRARSNGMTAWVRVNGIDTDFWADDLAALSGTPGL